MSTTLCQRVQPKFDARLVEPWTIQLLFPSPRHPLPELENPASKHDFDAQIQPTLQKPARIDNLGGGWSFLQSLSNPNKTAQIDNNNSNVYEHPLEKKTKSKTLSEKSLEMCTESLGSETGSTMSENVDDIMMSISSHDYKSKSPRTTLGCMDTASRKCHKQLDKFPPPLSTIGRSGGCTGVHVQSQRENGRLVLKAVVGLETTQSCFKAERRDGTLKLHFLHEPNVDEEFQTQCLVDDNEDDDEDEEIECEDNEIEKEQHYRWCGGCKEEGVRQNWEGVWLSTS